jgi:hypothetical protein
MRRIALFAGVLIPLALAVEAAAGTSIPNLAVNAPQQPIVPPASWRYIQAAQRSTVARDPVCSTSARREPIISEGAPGRALLATLGVLRQPRTAADALPQLVSEPFSIGFGGTREVFVNYTHRARSVLGASFYVIPAGNILGLREVPARCTGEEVAALKRELAQMPKSLGAQTVSLQAQYLPWQRYTAAHPQGIALATTISLGGGAGIAAGWTVADIDRGMAGLGLGGVAVGTGSSRRVFGGTGFHGIVPDGVAEVTLHYPARSANSKPLSVTVKVINNMFFARDPARQFPLASSWYDASGRLIKTVNMSFLTRGG